MKVDTSPSPPAVDLVTPIRGRSLRQRDGEPEPGNDLARELAAMLRRTIAGEVRFEPADRALWATDAGNYRRIPIGVVLPRSVSDIIETVAIAHEFNVPILPRGGGTSLAGQCSNVALVIDCSKYLNSIVALDPEARRARVLPGVVLDDLRNAAALHGLTFGPDPATHASCTLGGMIGNNSCGTHSALAEFYGAGPHTEDNVDELDILTYEGVHLRVGATSAAELERIIASGGHKGAIYGKLRDLRDRYAPAIRAQFADMPRRVSGYNLAALLEENGFHVAHALGGSEGTCATILEATVALVPTPAARALVVFGYPSIYDAGDHIPLIREFKPIGVEAVDDLLGAPLRHQHRPELVLPAGNGWLLVECGGDNQAAATQRARDIAAAVARQPNSPTVRVISDPDEQLRLWQLRASVFGAMTFSPGGQDRHPGWEYSAVSPEHLGDYLRGLRSLCDRYGYRPAIYGHFAHGCIHSRVDFDLRTEAGVQRFGDFSHDAGMLVARYGGSFSSEHGESHVQDDLLALQYGDDLLEAFREFKSIWDPAWRMNPGRIIDAAPRTADLRLGPSYHPSAPTTHFSFGLDGDNFAHATARCVGLGECRRNSGGTMCPSFMALHEEQHSTRGRAHLLSEMLRGEIITDGWNSPAVKESLDLCLGCKGCKSDCPVGVDIATYKAEFLSHYYEKQHRPRQAYTLGLVNQWAEVLSNAPSLVNILARTSGVSHIGKWLMGIAPRRALPRFAKRSFTRQFRAERGESRQGQPRAVLWPDTFNNYFHPETLSAAVAVLSHCGWSVVLPKSAVCCGRPLIEYGMLQRARDQLWRTIEMIRPEIEAGLPVVVLEPGCASVFRDELPALVRDEPLAIRLRDQTVTLAEFLSRHAPDVAFPPVSRRVIVQGHCHQKAVMTLDADARIYQKLGVDYDTLDGGCCGMAGSFGYEPEKFDLSMTIGERALLPAVRSAAAETLIMADGFSCREQIGQATDRRALHLAELLQLALTSRSGG